MNQRTPNHQKCFLLRLPSLLLLLYLASFHRPTTERTPKELRLNSQPPKVLFIKIAFSVTSLIPCLIPPTDDRENSEGTPTQLPITKKCCFLRFDQNLELLNCDTISTFTPYIISSTQKNRTKMRFFFAYPQNLLYLCNVNLRWRMFIHH